jgi:hypothetical protein
MWNMEWNEMKLPEDEYWWEIFQDFKQEDIALKNTSTAQIVSLYPPGTNAAVDNVFSLVNALWIDEWNWLEASTAKSIVLVKHNFYSYKCIEFYEFLLSNCWDCRTDMHFR